MKVHLDHKVQIVALITNEVFVTILAKYSDFADVFSKKSIIVLPEHIKINTYAINLEKDKQLPYGSIYSLGLVKLEILKIYIKTNLANGFICLFKSPTSALILFDKKLNESFWLCVNYQGPNNITIKNWYPLLFVNESLNCLSCAKQFTKLDLTSLYHQMRIKEGNKYKAAFWTRYSYFVYQVMSFGLTNIPNSF